jgi:spore germination protein KB
LLIPQFRSSQKEQARLNAGHSFARFPICAPHSPLSGFRNAIWRTSIASYCFTLERLAKHILILYKRQSSLAKVGMKVLDNGRISSVQLLLLLFMADVSSAAIYVPAKIAATAGPDGWFSVSVPTFFYGVAIIGAVLTLAGRFPSKVFTEYLPEIIGKVPGKLLAAAYALFFINVSFGVLNEISSFIHIGFMGNTPLTVLGVVVAIVALYGAYLGIEAIARENAMITLTWVLIGALVLVLVAKDIDFSNFRPAFENGIMPALKGSYFDSPWRGEVFILLMLFPYLNQKHEAFKTALWLQGMNSVFGGVTMLVVIGVFGDLVTAHLIFPYNTLTRYISVGSFIERMDILVVVVWISGSLVKLALLYHSSGIATASTLGLKNYRATLIPIAIATVILSQTLHGTYFQLIDFMFKPWPIYAFTMELAIPAIILLVAVLRKKKDEGAAVQ